MGSDDSTTLFAAAGRDATQSRRRGRSGAAVCCAGSDERPPSNRRPKDDPRREPSRSDDAAGGAPDGARSRPDRRILSRQQTNAGEAPRLHPPPARRQPSAHAPNRTPGEPLLLLEGNALRCAENSNAFGKLEPAANERPKDDGNREPLALYSLRRPPARSESRGPKAHECIGARRNEPRRARDPSGRRPARTETVRPETARPKRP